MKTIEITPENIKYYLPFTFLFDMETDIDFALENWKIKYQSLKNDTDVNELDGLELMNDIVNTFYYWSNVN
jgi:hypothetical protein